MSRLLDSINDTSGISLPLNPFDRIIGQDHAVKLVRSAVVQRRHVLLCGVPGIGKSMLAKAAYTLLPAPKQEIRLVNIPSQPNRPQIKITKRIEENSNQQDQNTKNTYYLRPDDLPIDVGIKMGYRCPRCSAISSPEHGICMDCGSAKRCDWTSDNSYHGLFRVLNVIQEVAQSCVIEQAQSGDSIERIAYYREGYDTIRAVCGGSEPISVDDKFATESERVLISFDSSRFVQASGSSTVELLGDVRHDPYDGADSLGTAAHLRVVPGAIHEAHEGILYIDEITALGQYQKHLLTAMQERVYAISGHNSQSSGAAVRVDNVPCDFILYASCNPEDLSGILPPLRSRIRGYGYEIMLSSWMEKTDHSIDGLVQFAAQTVAEDKRIPHLSVDSVHTLLSIAENLAYKSDGQRNALTLRLRELGGIIRISGDLAAQEGCQLIHPEHITQAEELCTPIRLTTLDGFGKRVQDKSIDDYGSYFF